MKDKIITAEEVKARRGNAEVNSQRVGEPLIAILVQGRHMLIEGYLRNILWLQNPVISHIPS